MSNKTVVKTSQSFPLGIILFLIFMTLKLCGVIAWSWWWITAPIWAPILIVLTIFAVVGIVISVASIKK